MATGTERQAWVLATTFAPDGTVLEAPRADALAISRRLMASGFPVTRRENADPDALGLEIRPAHLVVLYFSGPIMAFGGDTWLLSGPLPHDDADTAAPPPGWPLAETVRRLRAGGAHQVIAIVEGCHLPQAAFADLPPRVTATDPAAPEAQPDHIQTAPYPEDVVFMLSAAPGADCGAEASGPRMTERLTHVLAQPGTDFLAAFEAAPGMGWVEARLLHQPPALLAPPAAASDADARAELLRSLPPEEATQLAALWGAAQPTGPSDLVVIQPGAPAPAASTDAGLSLISVSTAQLAARPTAAGLPQPSVIVGEIGLAEDPSSEGAAPERAADLRVLPRAERLALREADPAAFEDLVQSGAFDPAPAELTAALQAEFQAARCYAGAIDGQWGPGSRAAVTAYFRIRGDDVPSQAPDLVLYRAVLAGTAAECPAAVAAPRNTGGSRSGGGGGARAGGAPTATADPPATPGERRIDASSVGLGIR